MDIKTVNQALLKARVLSRLLHEDADVAKSQVADDIVTLLETMKCQLVDAERYDHLRQRKDA